MFLQKRINYAFDLTEPHPLDEGVRVSYDERCLGALLRPDVRAVIWQRDFSDEVQLGISHLLDRRERGGMLPFRLDGVSSRFFRDSAEKVFTDDVRPCEAAVLDDVVGLAQLYNRNVGHRLVRNVVRPIFQFDDFSRHDDIVQSSNGWGDRANVYAPHLDSGIYARYLCNYSLNDEYTTEWYPGSYTERDVDGISQEIMASGDVDGVKLRHQVQKLSSGDVLALKGSYRTERLMDAFRGNQCGEIRKEAELLLHNRSVPQVADKRFLYVCNY